MQPTNRCQLWPRLGAFSGKLKSGALQLKSIKRGEDTVMADYVAILIKRFQSPDTNLNLEEEKLATYATTENVIVINETVLVITVRKWIPKKQNLYFDNDFEMNLTSDVNK